MSADTREQRFVDSFDEAIAQGDILHFLSGLCHGTPIVQNLLDVLPPCRVHSFRSSGRFVLKHFPHGCLRSFDARRQHSFLRCHGRQQDNAVGDGGQQPVVASQRRVGGADERNQLRPVEVRGRKPGFVVRNGIGHY